MRPLEALARRARRRTFGAGEVLFLTGEPSAGLWIIETGRVKVFKTTAERREHVLHLLGPGDTFNDIPALDSAGDTLDFLLNATRSRRAAKRFFRKVLGGKHVTTPRVINVDKNPTYKQAVRDLKRQKLLPEGCKRRPSQYMNNLSEQDHRFIKRRVKPGVGFFSYPTAWRTIRGYEALHMIRKGQFRGAARGNITAQNQFIAGLFG